MHEKKDTMIIKKIILLTTIVATLISINYYFFDLIYTENISFIKRDDIEVNREPRFPSITGVDYDDIENEMLTLILFIMTSVAGIGSYLTSSEKLYGMFLGLGVSLVLSTLFIKED